MYFTAVMDEFTMHINWDPEAIKPRIGVQTGSGRKRKKKTGAWIWGEDTKKDFSELADEFPKYANYLRLKRCVESINWKTFKKPKVLQSDRNVKNHMETSYKSYPDALRLWIDYTRRHRRMRMQSASAQEGEDQSEDGVGAENFQKIDIEFSKRFQPATTHLLLTGDMIMESFTPTDHSDKELTAVHMHLPVAMSKAEIDRCIRFIDESCMCPFLAVKVLVS